MRLICATKILRSPLSVFPKIPSLPPSALAAHHHGSSFDKLATVLRGLARYSVCEDGGSPCNQFSRHCIVETGRVHDKNWRELSIQRAFVSDFRDEYDDRISRHVVGLLNEPANHVRGPDILRRPHRIFYRNDRQLVTSHPVPCRRDAMRPKLPKPAFVSSVKRKSQPIFLCPCNSPERPKILLKRRGSDLNVARRKDNALL